MRPMADGLGEVDVVGPGGSGTKGITAAWKAPLLEFEGRHVRLRTDSSGGELSTGVLPPDNKFVASATFRKAGRVATSLRLE